MSAIIIMLLEMFGPLLSELLKKIIENLFNKAAKNVKATGDKAKDADALITEAIRLTPRVRVIRRGLLRNHAPALVKGGKLSTAEKAEIRANAEAASEEENDS
jgi:predicted Zn-dependent protease